MPGRRYDQTVSSGQVAEAGLRGRLPSPGGGCGGHVDARQPWPCTHRPDPALALHSPTRSSPGPAPAPPQWECRWCPQPQPPHPNRCSARWAARWAERTAGLGGRRRGRPQRRRAGCCSLRPAAGRGAAGRCFGAREAWKLAWLHGVAAAGAAHCGGALLSQRCMTGPPAACLRDALALAIPRPGPAMVPALQQALQQQQQQHGGGGLAGGQPGGSKGRAAPRHGQHCREGGGGNGGSLLHKPAAGGVRATASASTCRSALPAVLRCGVAACLGVDAPLRQRHEPVRAHILEHTPPILRAVPPHHQWRVQQHETVRDGLVQVPAPHIHRVGG